MTHIFVTPARLQEHLEDPNVVIVDGSWYLPTQNRDAEAEYLAGHIPGAVRFDLDSVILTETVFNLKGVGQYTADSVQSLDLPPIMGVTIYATFFIVLFSVFVDLDILRTSTHESGRHRWLRD